MIQTVEYSHIRFLVTAAKEVSTEYRDTKGKIISTQNDAFHANYAHQC